MPERSPSGTRRQWWCSSQWRRSRNVLSKQNRLHEAFYNINSPFAESPAGVLLSDKLCVANVALPSISKQNHIDTLKNDIDALKNHIDALKNHIDTLYVRSLFHFVTF